MNAIGSMLSKKSLFCTGVFIRILECFIRAEFLFGFEADFQQIATFSCQLNASFWNCVRIQHTIKCKTFTYWMSTRCWRITTAGTFSQDCCLKHAYASTEFTRRIIKTVCVCVCVWILCWNQFDSDIWTIFFFIFSLLVVFFQLRSIASFFFNSVFETSSISTSFVNV